MAILGAPEALSEESFKELHLTTTTTTTVGELPGNQFLFLPCESRAARLFAAAVGLRAKSFAFTQAALEEFWSFAFASA